MRRQHLIYLVCPNCKGELTLVTTETADEIESGSLRCAKCNQSFEIIRHIPRFVPANNYASSFGFEWLQHARTQYDSYTGAKVSETRFFKETKWPRQLSGATILEVGSGSGRFTEQAASTGAMVVSLDYSIAVEANYQSNGNKPNVLIVQGDIYRMPLRENAFERVFCIGVLQHTPDVKKSFMLLPRYLKPGGCLTVDVYSRNDSLRGRIGRLFTTKYLVRPITRRVPAPKLYCMVKSYVTFMWPLAQRINNIPQIGRWLHQRLLIADYRSVYDLPEKILLEWAILDAFDMLSPRYDQPQTRETVQRWFDEAGMEEIEVHFGYNGIEGRGKKPEAEHGRQQGLLR
jgi:SAM-dependent methyltransferase